MYNRSKCIILHVQFVMGHNGEMLIKELGILKDESSTLHYMIKPPYEFKDLPQSVRMQNLYNYRHINQLDWYCGDVSADDIPVLLRPYSDYNIIVKGREKKYALCKYFDEDRIVDMGELYAFSLTSQMNFRHSCPHHESDYKRCAINNVLKIDNWMCKEGLWIK